MNIEPLLTDLQAALAIIEAEWKAFQIVHKMQPKPQRQIGANPLHSAPYGQNQLWTKEDHNRDSRRLNDIDRNKP